MTSFEIDYLTAAIGFLLVLFFIRPKSIWIKSILLFILSPIVSGFIYAIFVGQPKVVIVDPDTPVAVPDGFLALVGYGIGSVLRPNTLYFVIYLIVKVIIMSSRKGKASS